MAGTIVLPAPRGLWPTIPSLSGSGRRRGLGKEVRKWTSREVAHSPPARGRQTGSPARFGSIRCSKHPIRGVSRRQRHLRAGCPDRLAHASARPDPDRDGRLRLGAALGRADRGNPARRRGLVSPGRKALARGNADDGDDAHRHPGKARRQVGGLDGTGQRRAIQG